MIIFTILIGFYSGFAQNNYVNYKISLNPDIIKKDVAIQTSLHKQNSSCLTQLNEVYLNTYLLNYSVDNKNQTLYFYESGDKQQPVVFITGLNKNNRRAVINLGFISSTGSLCKNITKQHLLLNHRNNIDISIFFKGLVTDFLSKQNKLRDTLNYTLIAVPLINEEKEIINPQIRQLINNSNQKIQGRQIFFIWNKGEIAKLPTLFSNCAYKEINLFNKNKRFVSNNTEKQISTLTAIPDTSKNDQSTTNPQETTQNNDYFTIYFQGFCRDGMIINYVISDNDGNNLSGLKSAKIINKSIKILKQEVKQYASDYETLYIELTPDEYGYFINTLENKNKIKLDDSSAIVSFTLKDKSKNLYISNIPKFYLFYVDANSFNEKIKLAKELQIKLKTIIDNNDNYFIYLANGNNPFYSGSVEGFRNILSRLTTQGAEVGNLEDDWATISDNIDVNYLQLIGSSSVFIDIYLSENVYLLHNDDLINIVIDNLGDAPWILNIITDFKIRKKLKIPKYLDLEKVNYRRIK
jgi:hypothetical protein